MTQINRHITNDITLEAIKKKIMHTYKYIILGGGTCAGYAADEAVNIGINKGDMAIVSAENSFPPDRPPFSKGYLRGEIDKKDVFINHEKFYEENGIDLYLNHHVDEVDLNNKTLITKEKNFKYEKLLITTGSKINKLRNEGSDLGNIFYLRSLSDSKNIRESARRAKKALVIGGMFIGTETAASLSLMGLKVTLVFPEDRVLQHFTNNTISDHISSYLQKLGVNIISNVKIDRFSGEKKVQHVLLNNGNDIETDLVVAGIGVSPAIQLFENTSLNTGDGIIVDEYTRTNIENVLAAGDVARFPDKTFNKSRRVEHWENAFEQGKTAANNLLGKKKAYDFLPYFFSDVGDLSYEYFGDNADCNRDIIRGNPVEGDFTIFFLKDDILRAAFITSSRPDAERNAVKKWIKEKTALNDDILKNEATKILEAARN